MLAFACGISHKLNARAPAPQPVNGCPNAAAVYTMPTPAERAAALAAELEQEAEAAASVKRSLSPKLGRHAQHVLARPRHTESDLKRLAHAYSAAGRSGEESAYWRYGIELTERSLSKIDRESPLCAALIEEVDKKMDKRLTRARRQEIKKEQEKKQKAKLKKLEEEGDSLASDSLTHHPLDGESSVSTWYGKTLRVGNKDVEVSDVHAGQHVRHRTTRFYAQARLGFAKCALCNLHFEQSSVSGITCNSNVMQFREKRGITEEGRRFKTASNMYDEVKLCVFCTQLLSNEAVDKATKKQHGDKLGVTMVPPTEPATLVKIEHVEESDDRLLSAEAAQSSTCDGRHASLAVDGDGTTASRTRREPEAWWEADCDPRHPIREVIITLEKEVPGAIHVFLLLTRVGPGALKDARKRSVVAFVADGTKKCIRWTLQKPLRAAAVRIQAEGTHALQLKSLQLYRAEHDAQLGTRAEQQDRDELGRFFGMMSTIDNQTQRNLHGPGSPLQQTGSCFDSTVSRRRRVVATPLTRGKSAFFHDDTRLISKTRTQPTPVELSRIAKTTRFAPALAAQIKRHKQPPGFESHEVDRLYWTTLLRYDHEAQLKGKRKAIAETFTQDQLKEAQHLFAACAPEQLDPDEDIEALTMDVSNVYTGLRQCASGLASTAAAAEDEEDEAKAEKLKFGLFELLDANSCFGIAQDLYKLARLDEKVVDEHFAEESVASHELRGPLQLEVAWPAFLALVALVRDRSAGHTEGDVFEALDVHTDSRLVDPAATQRREDALRSGCAPGDRGALKERARKQKGTPSRRLQSRAGPRRRLPPSSVEEELLDSRKAMRREKPHWVASQKKFEELARKLAPDVARPKRRSHLEVLEMRKRGKEKQAVIVAPEHDFRGKKEARRRHQRQLIEEEARPRRREKRMYNACGLCLQLFPSDSYTISAPHNIIISQLKNFGLSEAQLQQRGSESLALWSNRLPICVFCSQFLDPDEDSGMALRVRADRDPTTYQPFFDAAYPDTYTSTMRRLDARRARDDESTVTHATQPSGLPPAPAPA